MPNPELLHLTLDRPFPNNTLPVRLYRNAVQGDDLARRIEDLFKANGWQGTWRNGIFDEHHFHATAHEVLGCARGSVDVLLGGPNGETVTLHAGDIALLPAGTAHRNMGHSDDYLIIGAYPPGQSPDMEYGDDDRYERAVASIGAVPLPERDPVTGEHVVAGLAPACSSADRADAC
jgi:uncharacterized protein YjlB